MSCMTLFAPATMTTTPLARAVCFGKSKVEENEQIVIRQQPLRMSWVVVTGRDGVRHLRMRWRMSEDGN